MFSLKQVAASRTTATLALATTRPASSSAKLFYSSGVTTPSRSRLNKLLDGKHIHESIPVSQSAQLLFKNELNLESAAEVKEKYAKLSVAEKKTFVERAKASKATRQQYLDGLTRPQLNDLSAFKKAVAAGELKKLQAVDLIKSLPSYAGSAANSFAATFKGKNVKIDEIQKQWKNLADSEKKPFQDAAQKKRDAYPSLLETWKSNLSEEAISLLKSAAYYAKLPKAARRLLRPRTTRNPYNKFMSEEFKKPFPNEGNLVGAKLQVAKVKAAAAKWSALSAEEKQAYAN